jgi:hypothetical protein
VPLTVLVGDGVSADTAPGVTLDECEGLGPRDIELAGLAGSVSDRDATSESLGDGGGDGVPLAEPPIERVEVIEPVGVDEKVIVVEPVPEKEPVFEELAPAVNDAVGVRETDRERLVVELGVVEDDPVFVPVGVHVDVPLLVSDGETLELSEILAVTLALAPNVTDGVAEFENDALRLDVEEGVSDDVPVLDVVSDPVLVCEGVGRGVIDADNEEDVVGEGVKEEVGVPLADAPEDRVVEGDVETVVERLTVVEPLSLPDGV